MNNLKTQFFSRVISSLALSWCICSLFTPPVQAEGSRELTSSGGFRPFLDYRNDSLETGPILRRTVIQVYAQAGETLYLGSSAVGIGQGTIDFTNPSGASDSCDDRGKIENRAEEEIGPNSLFSGGYSPCTVDVDQTGVWQINFVSPDPASTVNPDPIPADDAWSAQEDNDNFVTAWDVTVADQGREIQGRAFGDYLALNMGGREAPLSSETYILTEQGYVYRIDLNGIEPFGFIFFSNNKGFRQPNSNPFFSSVPLIPPPDFQNPFTNPNTGDDRTHRIFLNRPAPGIPDRPLNPRSPGEVRNFRFIGDEGTPGQAASPGGGTFRFIATRAGSFRIVIDLNGDGVFGNDDSSIRDRIITGRVTEGENQVVWDGLDGNDNPIPGGSQGFRVRINLFAAQVHFPFLDVEASPNGIILERLNGQNSPDFTVYYDDSRFSGPGIPPDPLDASINGVGLEGINSSNGAHRYGCSDSSNEETCFGDRRGIDTWAFLPSRDFTFTDAIVIAEADLAIEKRIRSDRVVANGTIDFEITVTNNGPNDVMGATVRDDIPDTITDVRWTCAITDGSGSCGAANGTGNAIDTTVTLDPEATATYRVIGTLSRTASGTLTNTATVPLGPGDSIGDDVTDPNPDNNTSTVQTPIERTADLSLTKTTTPDNPEPGDNVTISITVTNDGPLATTDVQVRDSLPAGLSFVSATPRQGSYDNQTGVWTVGTLDNESSAMLQIEATLTTTETVVNRSQVIASDRPDPDSTPGNSIAGEDDQDSVTIPLQFVDLGLSKTARPNQTNVGDEITYTITLTNNDTNDATDVAVTEPLPPEVTFRSAETSQGSYNRNTGIWSVGNLANGNEAMLQINTTGDIPGSVTNTAVISALDQDDPNPGNDQASAEVFLVGEPHLLLVKRITQVRRDGQVIEGINFDTVVDDPTDPDDNAIGWSQLPGGGLLGVPMISPDRRLESGDTVEYTIYFLSNGGTVVNGVDVCDLIPQGTTFISDSFRQGSGIVLNQDGTPTPQSNASDQDSGTFFPPLNPVSTPCAEANNPNGAVVVELGDISSTAPNNVGLIRFRVEID
ncbi:hypothetical protein [Coleofasciculus chthonoplastes]|uniref:hypothetical protein n=1 Tax=Coleofasciculus chthonoplastes TaxID=64178 RepID=UPI0032F32799